MGKECVCTTSTRRSRRSAGARYAGQRRMTNRLMAIGFNSEFTCYLNVSRDVAVECWYNENYDFVETYGEDCVELVEFEFGDCFGAYEVWRFDK